MTSCGAKGGREMVSALRAGLESRAIDWQLETVHCMGKCHLGPTMRILPDGPYIMGVQASDIPHVLELLEANDLDALAAAFPLPESDPDA